MVEYRIVPKEFTQDTFKTLRLQYNVLVKAIISKIKSSNIPKPIDYQTNDLNKTNSRNKSLSYEVKNVQMTQIDRLHSRYAIEFTEMNLIGNGGFGSVFKVCKF